jgi:hypothetical protein
MYCDQKENLLAEPLEVWLSPFRYEVWLALSATLALVQICNHIKKEYSGSKMSTKRNIPSVIMFSESIKGLGNLVVLKSLAVITLTIYYESYITSIMMVPFETNVFTDVGQLLQDPIGYKIYYLNGKDHPLQPTIQDVYGGPLRKAGLDVSNIEQNYFVIENDEKYNNYWSRFQNHIKTKPLVTANWKMYVLWDLHTYENITKRKCHAVKKHLSEENSYWLFWWHFKEQLKKSLDVFVQSGIVGLWDVNGLYWDGIHNKRVSKDMEISVKYKSVSLGDKVSSVFAVWAWGLLGCVVLIILEYGLPWIRRRCYYLTHSLKLRCFKPQHVS